MLCRLLSELHVLLGRDAATSFYWHEVLLSLAVRIDHHHDLLAPLRHDIFRVALHLHLGCVCGLHVDGVHLRLTVRRVLGHSYESAAVHLCSRADVFLFKRRLVVLLAPWREALVALSVKAEVWRAARDAAYDLAPAQPLIMPTVAGATRQAPRDRARLRLSLVLDQSRSAAHGGAVDVL